VAEFIVVDIHGVLEECWKMIWPSLVICLEASLLLEFESHLTLERAVI